MSEILAPFEAMLDALFPLARVRDIDAGADWSRELAEVQASGFLDALAPGSGLTLTEVVPLWRALGHRAAPLAIGEAMIDRSGREAGPARALLLASAIAGAADTVLAMTVEHANQRVQFGKPIGRQQAVQQQLALMAEQAVAARLAVDLAATGDRLTTARAALAKTVSATYATQIANTAHAVLGAMGISAEHDLQIYTRRLHAWRLEHGSETHWAGALGRAALADDGSTLDWVRHSLF